MSFLNTKHKKKSFILTTILLSVLLLLLFYIGLTYMDPPIENGIAVNFGTTNYGSGRVQPKEKIKSEPNKKPITPPVEQKKVEEVKEVVPEKSVAENKPSEKLLTQESEESKQSEKQMQKLKRQRKQQRK